MSPRKFPAKKQTVRQCRGNRGVETPGKSGGKNRGSFVVAVVSLKRHSFRGEGKSRSRGYRVRREGKQKRGIVGVCA